MAEKKGFYGGGSDSGHRQQWDLQKYEEKAKKRTAEGDDKDVKRIPTVTKEFLQSRDYKIDLMKNVGKMQVVNSTAPGGQPGFYCNVCDCVVKDSINYLDHVNGKRHQMKLGISMKVEKKSLSDIDKKLESLKRKKEEGEKYDFEERVQNAQDQEEEDKRQKKEKKKEKKKQKLEESVDPELAAMMGFGGFGGKK